MNSGEVVGFIEQHPNRDSVAQDLVMECRRRWDELNNNNKNNNRIGDALIKHGCDDITIAIGFLEYIDEDPDL